MKKITTLTVLCLVFATFNQSFADTSTMALKNFRAILNSLAAVTGVDPTSSDISTYYQTIQAQLPRNGTLSEFNAQTYLASAGLGSMFCSHMITNDAQAKKPPTTGPDAGIDFTKGPNSVTTAQRNTLVTNYFNQFLQRTPTATELTTETGLFAAQIAKNTAAETQNAILAVCSAVAGSIEFLSN